MKKPFYVLLAALCCPALAQAATIEPGNWQTTITMTMPGMPFTPPPRTFTHCVTAHQYQGKPSHETMQDVAKSMQRKGCSMDGFSYSGAKAHWKMQCTGQHPSTGEAWITYENSKHYSSKMIMTMHDTGGGKMTMTSDSQWLGACK